MSQFFQIHPENPQLRLVKQAAQIISDGGIVALPTGSGFALVCRIDDKDAVTRVRQIRGIDDKHLLTLLCRDLSEIAQYAKVDNRQYRMLKASTPGPYTVILEATKEVPRRLSHPQRKTIGLRVPETAIAQALLEQVGAPLISTTLILPGQEHSFTDAESVRDALERQIELVIDSGTCALQPTTVIDLSGDEPVLVRLGRGPASAFGL